MRRHALNCRRVRWYDDGDVPGGGNVSDEMGIFRTTVGVESLSERGRVRPVEAVMVDTGSELTWLPAAVLESMKIQREKTVRFRMANGQAIERETGYVIVHAAGAEVPDEVVFALPGDLVLLGARSIEGLNVTVDLANKQFVAAGPMPV
jgi:predicted aspartyl protease